MFLLYSYYLLEVSQFWRFPIEVPLSVVFDLVEPSKAISVL